MYKGSALVIWAESCMPSKRGLDHPHNELDAYTQALQFSIYSDLSDFFPNKSSNQAFLCQYMLYKRDFVSRRVSQFVELCSSKLVSCGAEFCGRACKTFPIFPSRYCGWMICVCKCQIWGSDGLSIWSHQSVSQSLQHETLQLTLLFISVATGEALNNKAPV